MQVGGDGVDLAGLVLLAYLVSLAATLFAAGVAMRLRTLQAGPLMQMPVFLVLFLAPVYVPLGLLSGWVHAVATVNPITPIIETGRDFISGTPGPIALAYGIGAALVVLFGWWAARGLRSAEIGRGARGPGHRSETEWPVGGPRSSPLDDEDVGLRRAPAQLAQGRVVVGLVPAAWPRRGRGTR